ncbi:MAG: PIN domain-containing protein [Chitinivibrionales bacterium]|nr:PIN domain-containing protein [Chitinivibrionales bacterium]
MRLLLDTHVLLWMPADDPRLSAPARERILDPAVDLLFSAASYWEICLTISIGKLRLAANRERTIDREMTRNTVGWLPLEKRHLRMLPSLPWHHRDPFDRVLIAQAQADRLTILTSDAHIPRYDVPTAW